VLGARIVGNLDLSSVHAERAIALVRCRLDQVNLDLAEIESLDLSGSYATKDCGGGSIKYEPASCVSQAHGFRRWSSLAMHCAPEATWLERGEVDTRTRTLRAVQKALEAAGVEFLGGEG
jgi:hypothetical protein